MIKKWQNDENWQIRLNWQLNKFSYVSLTYDDTVLKASANNIDIVNQREK